MERRDNYETGHCELSKDCELPKAQGRGNQIGTQAQAHLGPAAQLQSEPRARERGRKEHSNVPGLSVGASEPRQGEKG